MKGAGTTQDTVTFHPAMVAAKKMEKKIHDQLEESGANKQLRHTAFEMALFGTGIMKGPFAVDKEYPNWNEEGDYDPLIKTVPSTNHVSVWNFYPDPEAASMDDAEYTVERHKMSRNQLRSLKFKAHRFFQILQLLFSPNLNIRIFPFSLKLPFRIQTFKPVGIILDIILSQFVFDVICLA